MMKSWKIISIGVTGSMALFVFAQSCMTLRDAGSYMPDIVVFPPYLLGLVLLFWIGILSVVGIRDLKLSKGSGICLLLLLLLSFHSLARGRYNTMLLIREAIFSPYGIGTWLVFIFALPASNSKFWPYFTRHLLFLYKLILALEVVAIALLLHNSKGLFRLNFSSSISLFFLCWGILLSNRSFTIWGALGLVLFELHSLIHDQRETFLMPLEFIFLLLPVYLFRKSLGANRRFFLKRAFVLFISAYAFLICIVAGYFILPGYVKGVLKVSHLEKDTRTPVLHDYFNSEMTLTKNYLLGKGVNGSYRSSRFSNRLGEHWRAADIEIGYLQTVLNVGLVFVVIVLLLGLIPSIRGILTGRNSFVVAAGLWVLVRLINMTMAARPETDWGWMLFWICIGVLNSTELRQCKDTDLKKMLS